MNADQTNKKSLFVYPFSTRIQAVYELIFGGPHIQILERPFSEASVTTLLLKYSLVNYIFPVFDNLSAFLLTLKTIFTFCSHSLNFES